MTKFLNKFYEKTNKYIETLESKQPVQSQKSSILLQPAPSLQLLSPTHSLQLLPPTPPLQSLYDNKSDVSNKSNPLHNIPVVPKKRGRKAASQGLESNEDYDKRLQRNKNAAILRANAKEIDANNANDLQQRFVNLEIPNTIHQPSVKSKTSVKQIREIFEGMPSVPKSINESLKSSSKSLTKSPEKLKKSN